MRYRRGTLPERSAEEIASQIRSLCGLRGTAPFRTMSPQQQRSLVTCVVGRTRREGLQGIFIKMVRFGKKKDEVYWTWELRGVLAVITGTATEFDELHRGTRIDWSGQADPSTISDLAALAEGAKPIIDKAFKPRPKNSKSTFRYKPGHLWTSSG